MDATKAGRAFLKADNWYLWKDTDHDTDERKGIPRLPVEKPYPEDAVLIDLVAPEDFSIADVSLRQIIGQRRSRRSYTDEPLTLEEFSFLLWATQGVVQMSRKGLATRRTVPSGGSIHEFETYLAISRIAGIEPGLYRYLPVEHKLLPLGEMPNMAERLAEGCHAQTFVGTGAVVFIWTAIPDRMEWRYTILAHKVIAQDSGHLCQNLYLASEAIGAGTCAIGAYDQKKMDALVGVDGEDEFVAYAAPVGKVR